MQEKDKLSDYSIFYLKHENIRLFTKKFRKAVPCRFLHSNKIFFLLDIIAYSMVRA